MSFHDRDALLYRLSEGLEESTKSVVFVVGAPASASYNEVRGVADVDEVVELIRERFVRKGSQLASLDQRLATSENRYQTAFDFLTGREGQNAANAIVKRAVAQALKDDQKASWADRIGELGTEELNALDSSPDLWNIPPAIDAISGLIARYPDRFGKLVITSNFDPLIEIGVSKHGGRAWRTDLATDGSLFQSKAGGCQVAHIHGYWHSTDTLHDSHQLLSSRPNLTNSLLNIIKDSIVVVTAYGGWPDIFTSAIRGVVANSDLMPEVIWTFFDEAPKINDYLSNTIEPGLARNRISGYAGIDCQTFFPDLLAAWDSQSAIKHVPKLQLGVASEEARLESARTKLFKLSDLECDRPPNVEVWVGREAEMRALETSAARVAIICGLGGEGKSVLASEYIGHLDEIEGGYRQWDWRDCKEQSDRIRTQVVEVIVRFSAGGIGAEDLISTEDSELVEILIDHVADAGAILVFDNVDSYVDLEHGVFIGLLDTLVQAMATAASTSRLLITCRPDVQYTSTSIITLNLGGISEGEAIELFEHRNPETPIPEEDVREAWAMTNGHAFWLDLLAVQVNKVPGTTLRKQLSDMRRGSDNVPDVLSSIWERLAERERTLLRLMAEAVRPETEQVIERFASTQLGYNKFNRAFKSLRSLNLIVVKQISDAPDLFDLHPLVRQFVRTNFSVSQRANYIKVVLNQYKAIIGNFSSLLGIHMPFAMLGRWSQKVELEVSAGLFEMAFETLSDAEDALIGGGHAQEYVRVARFLFEAIDWETAATKYKQFDKTVGIMIGTLDLLGEVESANAILRHYEATIPQKTARYIHYCDVKAYSHWQRGEFEEAVDWASQGVRLKKETNVDTNFDCDHTLALAQRDAGDVALAMESFLKGSELSELFNGSDQKDFDGPLYGNVGRCLQKLDRTEEALRCFKKSFKILERDSSLHSKSNRAYARKWVAEAMRDMGDAERAEAFLLDAIRLLGVSAPIRVRELTSELAALKGMDSKVMSDGQVTRVVNQWVQS
jgi:tetratricopeptide (TPR) repeat protein